VKREQSLTLSVTAGGEEAARWSEDVRQVPGEAFHLSTEISMRITLQYCPSREVGEYPMEESHAHCLCRREDICVTPAVHASPCSRRLLAGGWLVLTQSRGREGGSSSCVCPPTGRLRIYRVICEPQLD